MKKSILIHSQHANIAPGLLHIISVFIRRHDFGGGGVGGVLGTHTNFSLLLQQLLSSTVFHYLHYNIPHGDHVLFFMKRLRSYYFSTTVVHTLFETLFLFFLLFFSITRLLLFHRLFISFETVKIIEI